MEKQDIDGLPYHNDAMTSALVVEFYWLQYSWHRCDDLYFVSQLFDASRMHGAIPRLYIWKMFLHLSHMVFCLK